MQVKENASKICIFAGVGNAGNEKRKNTSEFYDFFIFGDELRTLLCIFMRFNIFLRCYRRSFECIVNSYSC